MLHHDVNDERGVGFKSAFLVSSQVLVMSARFDFYLDNGRSSGEIKLFLTGLQTIDVSIWLGEQL